MSYLDERYVVPEVPGDKPGGQEWTPWPQAYHDDLLVALRTTHGGALPDWAIIADCAYLQRRRMASRLAPEAGFVLAVARWGCDERLALQLWSYHFPAPFSDGTLDRAGGVR